MNDQKEERQRGLLEMTATSGGFSILYSRIPFRRNQDVIRIQKDRCNAVDVISVVDGWNDVERVPSDHPGREAASFVASRYPEAFLALKKRTLCSCRPGSRNTGGPRIPAPIPCPCGCGGRLCILLPNKDGAPVARNHQYMDMGWNDVAQTRRYRRLFFARAPIRKRFADLLGPRRAEGQSLLRPTG